MIKLDLCGEWQGYGKNPDDGSELNFTGTVPGCVHTDLMSDYITPDLFWRDNAKSTQWIEKWNWRYTKTFNVDKLIKGATLNFEGLDVYCDIFLNNTHIGKCDDMFIPYSFPVDGILKQGENTLEVYFYSPVRLGEGHKERYAAFSTPERLYTRRIQCTYGWDWVMRFVTCGIWKPVYLTFNEDILAESVYVYTNNIDSYSAQIVIEPYFVNCDKGGIVEYEILNPDGENIYKTKYYTEEESHRTYVDIASPSLWYPTGYGEQPIYTLKITVNGEHQLTQHFGIRIVKLMQLTDVSGSEYERLCKQLKKDSPSADYYDKNEISSGFILVINGIKIMCKGANWVPCSPFPSDDLDKKITSILELSKEGGVNMVRVWGGGIFERQHFYNECDRLGILVTQDFLMACGQYPEDDINFIEHLKAEATYSAKALRNHPSLVWWTGDNENAVFGCDTDTNYNGRIVAHKAIGPILRKLDSQRQFLPSSPYGGNVYASKTVGTTHNTQYLEWFWPFIEQGSVADYKSFFLKNLARFVAEEPAMGATSLPSMKRMMTEEDIFGKDNSMWYYHTQGNPALPKELFDYIDMFAEKLLGKYKDKKDRYFKLKYLQYEWIRVTLENFRSYQWFTAGIIYWMLDDCWPAAVGWSIIDYYGIPKAGYYGFKRCAKPIVLSMQPKDDKIELIISSNTIDEKHASIEFSALKKNGDVEPLKSTELNISANQVTVGFENLTLQNDQLMLIAEIHGQDFNDRTFYMNGNPEICPCGGVTITERTNDSITLKSDSYVHAVEFEGDAVFEDNYFSMLPKETRRIEYRLLSNNDEITLKCYTLEVL